MDEDDSERCLLLKTQIKIRSANIGDIENFVSAYILSYSDESVKKYSFSKISRIKKYFKWLLRKCKENLLVAEVNGKIAGFICCDTNFFSKKENRRVLEIHEFFVIPEYRGIGIGKMLLEKSIEIAKNNGIEIIELVVGEENFRAISFYEKNNFEAKEKIGRWVRMIKKIK
ncbi:MAG: GNAT family N-acetyltransferase [Candidatus Aenigmatarchaeota archaeon]